MLVKWKWFVALAMALTLSWLTAALGDEAAPPSLSLQDCIAIALQRQIDVLVGQNGLESARGRERSAKSNYYPQVSVQDNRVLVKSGLGAGQLQGTSVNVSENFYDGGLREAQVRGARAGVAQSTFSLQRTEQTVTFNVTSSYFALLQARQLADVQEAQVKYLEEQRAMVQAQIDVGSAAPVDVLPVEAQLATARVSQLSAKNAVLTSAIKLQNVMGLPPQAGFSVQDVAEPAATEPVPLEDYARVALANRPDVQGAGASVEAARSSVQSAKIVFRPRPVVSGQFGQSLSDGSSHSLTITGGIVYALFDGGANRAAYDQARAGLSSAELQAAQLEKDIEAQVQQAYLNLTNARERLAATDLSLKAAQKNYDAQRGRYEQGLAITLDLLNAQSQVVTAQSNAVQARYDYYTSMAQLQYAIGKQGELK
jgi:outer membrane protein TolC